MLLTGAWDIQVNTNESRVCRPPTFCQACLPSPTSMSAVSFGRSTARYCARSPGHRDHAGIDSTPSSSQFHPFAIFLDARDNADMGCSRRTQRPGYVAAIGNFIKSRVGAVDDALQGVAVLVEVGEAKDAIGGWVFLKLLHNQIVLLAS